MLLLHVGVFQALPGRLGGLQEPPGASMGGGGRLRRVCKGSRSEWMPRRIVAASPDLHAHVGKCGGY